MLYIRLESSDGQQFEVDVESVKCCGTRLRNTLESDVMNGLKHPIVKIPVVDGVTLGHVLNWATLKQILLVRNSTVDSEKCYADWKKQIFEMDIGTLHKLLEAAKYLDNEELVYEASTAVANTVKGKSPEELRQIFEIENDFTPEEEELIREENSWCE